MAGVRNCIRLWMDGVIQRLSELVLPGWELAKGVIPLLLVMLEGIRARRALELTLSACLFGDKLDFLGEDVLSNVYIHM